MTFIALFPEREVWRGNTEDLVADSVQIFTYGSKLNGAVSEDMYLELLGISRSIRLLKHCSVFQAEVSVIQAVVEDCTGHANPSCGHYNTL